MKLALILSFYAMWCLACVLILIGPRLSESHAFGMALAFAALGIALLIVAIVALSLS